MGRRGVFQRGELQIIFVVIYYFRRWSLILNP
jgi:hypothetical protein